MLSVRAVPRSYKEDKWGQQDQFCTGVCDEKSVGREPAFREDLSAETEEYPLLEAVTRELLVKTRQARKDLACAMVICKVWRLAMTL
jgi:hypothetical protein